MLAVLHVSDHVAFPLAAGMVLAAWVYKVVSVTYVHICNMHFGQVNELTLLFS